jgi:hypothetical protein
MNNETLLKFGSGNSKLAPNIFTFSLPAGYSCPGADKCLSKAVEQPDGRYKIVDGKNAEHRCFAAIDEALKPAVRKARWHNFNTLLKIKSVGPMAELIQNSLPVRHWKYIVRIHVSGDFYNQTYVDAWIKVAQNNPRTLFYAYTKSLPQIGTRLNDVPDNMKIVASLGGKFDQLIPLYKLRFAQVVLSEGEAEARGLEIDHDDSHAYEGTENFALLLHGTQPAGSLAAAAWQQLKNIGKAGYHNHKRGRGWGGKNYAAQSKKKSVGVLPPMAIAA